MASPAICKDTSAHCYRQVMVGKIVHFDLITSLIFGKRRSLWSIPQCSPPLLTRKSTIDDEFYQHHSTDAKLN
ncbi:hypothetical protein [Okeania sp. SIO1F9]|uniref:hypothetical protein n=1 Tax=Okeania sp. SIO1F9 TaxID=2607813 RepID=UPI0014500193|nr:hypothetical protein [Okeania sp. SIO1F9]NET79507.1 hypothetical protein [Okeania sp. SIO1F9]